MSQKKRQQAYRNSKLSPDQGEIIRVPIDFADIRRGDGVKGIVEDVIGALVAANTQFYVETAGMGLVGTVRIDLTTQYFVESARVEVETPPQDPPAEPPATQPKRGAFGDTQNGITPQGNPVPVWQEQGAERWQASDGAEPEAESQPSSGPAPDPARRELALQQALKLLEDFRDNVLTYREDVVSRIEESVWPELVHSIVTQVRRKYVSKTSGPDIRWNEVKRIPDALPTREQLELTGHIRSLKKEGKGTVHIKVHEVISKQHNAAIDALRRRGTGSVPLGYSTEAVRRRLSLFDSTPHLLRFIGTAAKGLVAGDRFEFMVTSVELANADETALEKIEQVWHEELHRK